MGAILKQRNLFITREFEISDRFLKVNISKPLSSIEDEFNLEDISTKTVRKRSPNKVLMYISLALLVFMLITIISHFTEKDGSSLLDILVYAILFVPSLFLFYITYQNVVHLILNDKRYLIFYANSPTKLEVDEFLENIKQNQKKYLLNRYAKQDPYVSDEQLANNLQWLYDRKIITETEFEELRSKLLPKIGSNLSVGFKFNPGNN